MNSKLSNDIKAEAINLGFYSCGIAEAAPVDGETAAHVLRWIGSEGYAGMQYMANNTEKRLDPTLLMDGVKSIVCVALNYFPPRRIPEGEFQFADYALGSDYHDVVKSKLFQLAAHFGFENFRVFCDTAPVLERYWAVRAGLGWTGRNHQLIIPHAGSKFFLGELFLDIPLEYDSPMPSRCGSCHACIDACPTGALSADRELDASLCLSYQTIENRGEIPHDIACKMGDTIYGCDRCQAACPWNRFATPTTEPLLQPRDALLEMTRSQWESLTVEQYQKIFKGSAVKRVKYGGLMRNIHTKIENDKENEDR